MEEKAKRVAPKPVTPFIHNNIEYSAGTAIGMGQVQARDLSSNTILWKKPVYTVQFDSNEEKDVQTVYITKIELHSAKVLKITDEHGTQHLLNI